MRKPVVLVTGAGGEIGHGLIENLSHAEGYSHQKGIFPAREAVVMETQNRGIRGVTAEDVFINTGLSAQLSFIGAEPEAGDFDAARTNGEWRILRLASGEEVHLRLHARPDSLGPHTLSGARFASAPQDPEPANDTAAVSFTAIEPPADAGAADLELTLSPAPSDAVKGQVVCAAGVAQRQRRSAQIVERRQPCAEDRARGLVALQINAADLAGAIVQVEIDRELLVLGFGDDRPLGAAKTAARAARASCCRLSLRRLA